MSCNDCEQHKLSAAMWRNEAYKHAGTPLPWEPEELLRKEYERGFIDGMQKQMQSSVDKAVNAMSRTWGKPWVSLTDEERSKIWGELPQTTNEERDACIFAECIELYLKEKNT